MMFKNNELTIEKLATVKRFALIAVCSFALVVAVALSGCAAPAPEAEPAADSANVNPEMLSVEISVTSAAANAKDPKWPTEFVKAEKVDVKSGSNVFDVLDAAKIEYKVEGDYITEIEGLSEKSVGGGSGWLYFVNGETPVVDPGSLKVKDGDKIVFDYFAS